MRQPTSLHVKSIATLIFKHSKIMQKIHVKTVAAGNLKILDLSTNEERIITLSILIEIRIRLNHRINHDFFMLK